MNALAATRSRRLARGLAYALGIAGVQCAGASSFDSAIATDDGRALIEAGDTTQYTILVTNSGPDAVSQATVHVSISGSVAQATWTCTTDAGTPCAAAQGAGAPVQLVDIPVGHSLIYRLDVTSKSSASGSLDVFGMFADGCDG